LYFRRFGLVYLVGKGPDRDKGFFIKLRNAADSRFGLYALYPALILVIKSLLADKGRIVPSPGRRGKGGMFIKFIDLILEFRACAA
jgi:hypothetical protein